MRLKKQHVSGHRLRCGTDELSAAQPAQVSTFHLWVIPSSGATGPSIKNADKRGQWMGFQQTSKTSGHTNCF